MYTKLKLYLVTLFLLFLNVQLVFGQNKSIENVFLLDKNDYNSYVEFFSSDIKDFFHSENESKYPSTQLFDGFINTCWIAGSSKQQNRSELWIKLPSDIPLEQLKLNIFGGYGKSKALFVANSRPQKIKVATYLAIHPKGASTEVANFYFLKKLPIDRYFTLKDVFAVQSIPLHFNKNSLLNYKSLNLKKHDRFLKDNKTIVSLLNIPVNFMTSYVVKIEIETVYQGNKYDDICISELFFNDRFVVTYPNKYYQINKLYIKDGHTLLADYPDKKAVEIYQNKDAVITIIDWIKNSNWAILHYVLNDEVGSRVEENEFLFDLRNKKIVNDIFKKFTGVFPADLILKKNEKGNILLNSDQGFKIILK